MSASNVIHFIYKNLGNEVKEFSVGIDKVYDYHFAGIDLDNDRYKTFRKDSVIEYLNDAEAVFSNFPTLPSKKPSERTKTRIENDDNLFEVCFTGFKKADKDRLIALAKENKMYVVTKVTVNLAALVCGYNAGPKKIEQAINSSGDVEIMNEEEFLHFLETGEVQADL